MIYDVTIARTITQRLTVQIEADTDLQAFDKAEENEGNYDFNAGTSGDADYEIVNVEKHI